MECFNLASYWSSPETNPGPTSTDSTHLEGETSSEIEGCS